MYTDQELNSLIESVEKEFTTHLAKTEESLKLAKSEEESEKKDKETDFADKSGKKMESEKPEDKGVKDQDQEKDSKVGERDQKEVEDNRKDKESNSDDDHGYDEQDMQDMHKMYSSMSKSELKAHHDSIRKCMDGMGLKKCEDGMAKSEEGDAAKDADGYRPNGGPKDGEKAPMKTPKMSDNQALNKSEKDTVIDFNKDKEITLLKSELETAKSEGEAHKKNLDAVEAFLKKFIEKTAPAGKAITSLNVIAKTEHDSNEKPLQKSEIDAKLMAKAKDLTLSKSDRDAINSYYFTKNIETVRHLLK